MMRVVALVAVLVVAAVAIAVSGRLIVVARANLG